MDKSEAEARFNEADDLYREGRYEDALHILDDLNAAFPNKHRLLYPKARCLAHLGRFEEASAICDTLLNDFEYERATELREQLDNVDESREFDSKFDSKFDSDAERRFSDPRLDRSTPEPGTIPPLTTDDDDSGEEFEVEAESEPRFRIKPFRTLIAIALIVAAALSYIPWWAAAAPIVAYFVIGFLIRRAMYRLFTVPFKMKGKALAGAVVKVHAVTLTDAPADASDWDEDGETPKDAAWYEIEATITPQERSEGFTSWEIGELALASVSKPVERPEDLDHTYAITDVHVWENGAYVADEGFKVPGERRIRFRAALPPGAAPFRLVYYFETLHGDMISL